MSDVRQRIDESWDAFLAVIDEVPEDRLEEKGACGEWSVKDLMAHMAYWDDRAIYVADTIGAGNEVEPINWQEVNTQEAALRASWTVEESRAEMHAAHARLLEAVDRHPDLGPGIWEGNTFEHYDEHAADVRAFVGMRD
ncbi:hypothetical protein BH23CHL2_BH23CHL2_18730 [soil metagenome]